MDMIIRGNEYRTMSPTEANATSSRSHAVLQINLAQKDRNADINEPHTMATLSIIDLAGSERASATKNRGERLLEGANINKSLLALGSCINALCDPRVRNHVPYRNSKLTRLLKFSLGGNCKTVMIVCVSPSSAHFDETQNTLRYANRAKNIQTKVTRNVYNVNRHVKDFLKKIDEQMAMINELKQQQKDQENIAFAKFRKQLEKKENVGREGIARIRAAYEHSQQERQERINMMKKLRQIERRISLISAWVAGFDAVCEAREEEEPPKSLMAMRKTAQGILAELEGSRQHYHQRISKASWDRAIETALQTGLRQLRETDDSNEAAEASSLMREAELLRSIADREAYTSLLDLDKGGDAAMVQVLLQAHFDTIAILGQILQMTEDEAVRAAKKLLGQLVNSCTTATSQIIKPDGGLPVTEVFPPTKMGTPKQRKAAILLGPSSIPSPIPAFPRLSLLEPSEILSSSPLKGSPFKSSPKRRKLGGPKKTVILTPRKRSPIKGGKRGVRWRDDTDSGTLVEYQATPQQAYSSTPEVSSSELPPPPKFSEQFAHLTSSSSSPSMTLPDQSFMDSKPRPSRFQAGFLSKKSDGSPQGPPSTSSILQYSSDSDNNSPLRELDQNKVPHMSSLHVVTNASSDVTPADSGSSSFSSVGSDDESRPSSKNPFKKEQSPQEGKPWGHHAHTLDAAEAKQVRTALRSRRASAAATSVNASAPTGVSSSAARVHRRRSPTASSGSPPASETSLTAGQARRMGAAAFSPAGSDSAAGWSRNSVLSPRSAPIIKLGGGSGAGKERRTTVADTIVPGSASRVGANGANGAVRLSAAALALVQQQGRGSLAGGSKAVWR
jgi:kinesin family member 18/19